MEDVLDSTMPSNEFNLYRALETTSPSMLITAVRRAGVVGQDRFVSSFAQQLCLQITRICAYHRGVPESELPRLSGPLVTGPTASGKSFTIRKFAEALGIHDILFVDCSKLTGEGWKGESVSTHLGKIADMQQEHSDTPIIVVWDEVDKLVKYTFATHDGFDPQKDFLTFLDGGIYEGESMERAAPFFALDTNYVINLFAGAFTGIEENVRKRLTQDGGFGFGASKEAFGFAAADTDELRSHVCAEDLIAYGLARELVGRFSAVIPIQALPMSEVVKIANNSPHSTQARFQKMMPAGVKFRITNAAARLLANEVQLSGVGVRALEQTIVAHVGESREVARTDRSISHVILDAADGTFTLKYRRPPGYTRPSTTRLRYAGHKRLPKEVSELASIMQGEF